jgi:hypothetical protein
MTGRMFLVLDKKWYGISKHASFLYQEAGKGNESLCQGLLAASNWLFWTCRFWLFGAFPGVFDTALVVRCRVYPWCSCWTILTMLIHFQSMVSKSCSLVDWVVIGSL